MAYSELDAIPSHINPMLYKVLDDWGFDGFVTADDTGMAMLMARHGVADSPASAIMQWFNAGKFCDLGSRGLLMIWCRWDDTVLRLPASNVPECHYGLGQ